MEKVEYDEFGLFHENAQEYGIAYDGAPAVRREFVEVEPGRKISALVWGTGDPEVVLIHGGAQNAHTWDTVALAMDVPLVAVDLPGHGHSDGAGKHGGDMAQLSPEGNAADVAAVIDALAPNAKVVAGMSLGGITSIALIGARPDLVRRLVLVDITPGVNAEKSKFITNFVNGPATFPSFSEILARTIEHNPTRTEASLRRGILHNAVQEPDGSWVWRYRRDGAQLGGGRTGPPEYGRLWDILGSVTVPVMLLRGMLEQSVVDDTDEVELLRRLPAARVEHLEQAGHSIQGDTPLEMAALMKDFAQL